jgi:hypothetical protein
MSCRVWWRTSDGTETGTQTVNVTGGTKGAAWISAYRPSVGGNQLTPLACYGSDTDSSSTAVSFTGPSATSAVDNLWVGMLNVVAPSGSYSGNLTAIGISQSGATVAADTARFGGRTATNTVAYGHTDAPVTTGGTGAPTYTATAVGANASGSGVLVLVVEAPGDVQVDAVAFTATAAANAPAVAGTFDGTVNAVTFTATASAQPPSIDNGGLSPEFRAAATGSETLGASTTTALTPTIPAEVQEGDVGFIVALGGGGSGAATAPSGWSTLVSDTTLGTGGARFSVFTRTYVAGDPNPTVNWPSAPTSGNNLCAPAVWYSGVGSITAGTVSTSSTASTDWTAPSLTTPANDHTVLAVSGEKGGSTGWGSIASWSPDATMRASRYGTGNFYPSVVFGDLDKPTAGATNAQTASWNFSTSNGFAVQIDLAPTGVGASVTAVTGTATAAALAPGTGSNVSTFPPALTASASLPIPAIEAAASVVSGGGPFVANAAAIAPGIRQRVIVNVQATATAAGIAPAPPSSSNFVPKTEALAEGHAPFEVTGGAVVTAVTATATAAALAPGQTATINAVPATATAAGLSPSLGEGQVRAPAATASAAVMAPVVGGNVTVIAATASASGLAPVVGGRAVIVSPPMEAAAIFTLPVVGHKEWVLTLPTYDMHYTNDPLMKRIAYPTPQSLLLIEGFYQLMSYPDDELIAAADKTYLGGYTHIISTDEVNSLVAAGYGDYISQEVFVTP